MFRILQILFKRYFELTFWVTSIAILAVMPPAIDPHYSLCLFKLLGINFCPGCGLGHAISYLLRGNFQASFSSHPLASIALIVIICRIYKLLQLQLLSKQIKNHYAIR